MAEKTNTKKDDEENVRKTQVVRSKSGRDKRRFFMILKVEYPFVYLVDGKLRKLDKPKKKKIMHIAITKTFLEVNDDTLTDKRLRLLLKPFNDQN